jgi:hypothetical protein
MCKNITNLDLSILESIYLWFIQVLLQYLTIYDAEQQGKLLNIECERMWKAAVMA